jgi:hypothetical protein
LRPTLAVGEAPAPAEKALGGDTPTLVGTISARRVGDALGLALASDVALSGEVGTEDALEREDVVVAASVVAEDGDAL